MKIIVLGAGLAGITSAWYLSAAGHAVTVVDRHDGPGEETSFANGGQISASHPEPWANPRAPGQILRWLGRKDAPLLFRPRADLAQWSWGLAFLRECLPARTRRNTAAIARLAVHSRVCLDALREQLGLDYDQSLRGILHTFFGAAEFAHAPAHAELLRGFGMRAEVCDVARCVQVEPALAETTVPLLGGLFAPDDESGDAHKFVRVLAQACAQAGVTFHYRTEARGLDVAQGRVIGVRLVDAAGTRGALVGDAYVLALGSYSGRLMARRGERLPVYPVKGYSVTLPAGPGAPHVSITDESRRIVVSRLGERVRIAGTAELNGFNTEILESRCRPILARAQALFPRLGDDAQAEFWAGLRPTTPSNVPVIGASRIAGLYYNTGHGTLGWTLACGSAEQLARIVGGEQPTVDFPFHGGRRA